ncbi:WD40/YVTN/BNR-like repeat-containing protein [Massilia aerilata]|uniref:WD40/YVTN/BNR-like repeat-containing protein n=1 Tax=Massilia aerilata TaxID=453817 RepID=A0ABW0S3D4_9BURK
MIQHRSGAALAAASLLLAACGAGSIEPAPVNTATKIEVLATSTRGIGNVVYKDGAAWATLSNSAQDGSAVMKTPLPLQAASRWSDVPLGACALPKQEAGGMARTPMLRALGSTLWLFQPAQERRQGQLGEHSLCALDGSGTFAGRDQPLESCIGEWCAPLAMDELKLAGNRLYTNAGGGPNLFVSDNAAANWRVVLGQFDSMICTHQAFELVGDRLLVGGECPLDSAYLRAYRLGADGRLASNAELPITLPTLENRNVQFIEQVANTQRVFAGVEGGLLRSEDGGQSFKFVIQQPLEGGKTYPYIRAFLALSGKPDTMVVGGFDKANALPYLAWSADGGSTWTDISPLLPGHARAAGDTAMAEVTSLSQDPQGRVIVTMNLKGGTEGRVLLLTLGKA